MDRVVWLARNASAAGVALAFSVWELAVVALAVTLTVWSGPLLQIDILISTVLIHCLFVSWLFNGLKTASLIIAFVEVAVSIMPHLVAPHTGFLLDADVGMSFIVLAATGFSWLRSRTTLRL